MVDTKQIQLFMSVFRGRTDVYARHWEKNGKSGYSPAYEFNWGEFMAHKARGGNLSNFPNKKTLLLTLEVLKSHLEGIQAIGIYPLLEDNTSYFIAADFDKENWQAESTNLIKVCKQFGIPAYLERSRSGSGAHVWIFFEEKYSATKSRSLMLELIRKALNLSEFEKEVSFDRLFPNQDYHTNVGFGNLIALPLQGIHLPLGNTAFLNPETLEIISDQWKYLNTIQKLSEHQLDNLYATLVNGINSNPIDEKSNSSSLTIIVNNHIKLPKSHLTPILVQYLRENLNFFNTEYLIKKRIGISTYQTEKYFKLITEEDEHIYIPRGFLDNLLIFCKEKQISYKILDQRKLKPATAFKSKIKLYDYQKRAVDEIKDKDFGVIVAPSGSGKTVIGLKLVAEKSQPALILVHREQLLNQWIERIESFLGISKTEIGQISGRKKKLGKQITVAMMQSLIKMATIDDLTNQFGTIIIDECHHIPAKTFRELIVKFNPYYLYGLTATPKRKYNDEKLIYFYIGDIIAEIDPNKEKSTATRAITLHIKQTDLSVPFDYKIDEFETLSKILTFDSSRNNMIAEDILNQVKEGRKVLVLTERREHVETLNLYLQSQCEVITLTGEDSISKRKVKTEQIKLGHFQVLVATGQLFGEGMDLPLLDSLFIVYPFSFEGKLIQYIGRIQRSANQQMIFDYHDKNIDYFDKLFKKRRSFYRKRGWIS
ncbi:DEAD/DEAH box helicase family protein [Candidatus Daviesbacteria bacterium]|nr:DEAD/DEAH box helicase family protein [Candidatus Daviesbacteria bacterium]